VKAGIAGRRRGDGRRAREVALVRDDEGHRRDADADDVAVLQPPAAVDALAVEEGAVARAAVVDERPLLPHPLERRVHARHGRVPGQRDVAGVLAADRQAHLVVEQQDALVAVALAVEHERHVAPGRVEALLELPRGGGAQRLGQRCHELRLGWRAGADKRP